MWRLPGGGGLVGARDAYNRGRCGYSSGVRACRVGATGGGGVWATEQKSCCSPTIEGDQSSTDAFSTSQAVNDIISPREAVRASSSRWPMRAGKASVRKGSNATHDGESQTGSSRRSKGSEERRMKRRTGRPASAEHRDDRIASFVGPAHKPDILCAFCQGTAHKNFVTAQPEVLISCVECGSSGESGDCCGRKASVLILALALASPGHPSCMKWGRNQRKTAVAQNYNWRCMECKTCEICCEKGDDVSHDGTVTLGGHTYGRECVLMRKLPLRSPRSCFVTAVIVAGTSTASTRPSPGLQKVGERADGQREMC